MLTRSAPVDDGPARRILGRGPIPIDRSLRDLLVWMHRTGVLEPGHVGRLATAA